MFRKITRAFIFICSLFCIIVTGFFTYHQYTVYSELKAIETSLDEKIEAEKAVQEKLRLEMEYNLTDAYVEKIARERLGLFKSDEIIFIDESTVE
ncbi:FtsB family cell division protein [Anaeropeptidivorans aminofermentans]|jgi:cell division protein DivIC|uniref:FtsB family cell division protein n=1 Tax=Anaeropeptidivorans aminofermentans TaxID=2934315 RepID=UPI0020246F14|nr:septum formation initiator family protein [Anaeropeptidivorans aminofermentans]MBE6013545.1 hypothetical protein [Lachnospiraceae bacterium]